MGGGEGNNKTVKNIINAKFYMLLPIVLSEFFFYNFTAKIRKNYFCNERSFFHSKMNRIHLM